MASNKDFLDELLAKTDIVKLIAEYVPLTKKGMTWWGCCPFHHEKTPSFTVTEDRQLYHCFGCSKGGNAITFIKDIENIGGGEAVRYLAKRAGIEVPASSYIKTDSKEDIEKKEKLYEVLKACARHYHKNLYKNDIKAKKALEYLYNRGVTDELIRKFGLGYSLNGNDIIIALEKQGFSKQELKDAGILEQKADSYYDVYYDRLIFPIIDNFGDVVAFGGRTLIKNPEFAKYRNTSKTDVFDKSRVLYGVNLLKKKKLSTTLDYIIIAEGYMDVIALHKGGFDSTVASMGTALTTNQARQLKMYCNKVLICYDGDSAGQKATLRGLDILSEYGLDVRVITLPEGLDPDDIIKTKGKEFFQQLLDSAVTLVQYKINQFAKQYDLNDIKQKAEFAVEAVKVINALENPVEKEEYLKKVQKISGYSMSALYAQSNIALPDSGLNRLSNTQESDQQSQIFSDINKETKEDRAAIFILASIANNKDFAKSFDDFDMIMKSGIYKAILDLLLENRENDKNHSQIYSKIDEEYGKLLNRIFNYKFVVGDNSDKYNDCINILKLKELVDKEAQLQRLAETQKNDRASLLKTISQISEIQQEIRKAKAGGNSNE